MISKRCNLTFFQMLNQPNDLWYGGQTNNDQNILGGEIMAKKGMKRPEVTHTQPRNDVPPVPELQGNAKRTKAKAKPIIKP